MYHVLVTKGNVVLAAGEFNNEIMASTFYDSATLRYSYQDGVSVRFSAAPKS